MENRLIKEAIIAVCLFSNFMKNIGIIETIPNIKHAIMPLSNAFINICQKRYFLSSYASLSHVKSSLSTSLTSDNLMV